MEIFTRENWEEMMTELNKTAITKENIEFRIKILREKFYALVDEIPMIVRDQDILRAIAELSTQIAMTRHLMLTIAKEGFYPHGHLQ